jgi:hypothetical protein
MWGRKQMDAMEKGAPWECARQKKQMGRSKKAERGEKRET